ncbi:cytochrome P450 [Phlebopus sp. FC_14]|nr:cytochrome P450 [Phlebopus sp. FC_14]
MVQKIWRVDLQIFILRAQRCAGDIYRVRLLTQDAIIVNSLDHAKALLEQRSQIYSSRPYIAAVDILDCKWNLAFAPYGDRWRLRRRVFQQPLRPEGLVTYRPVQLRCARELVKNMIEAPAKYAEHLELHSASIIMSSMYDHHPTSPNDVMMGKMQDINRIFTSAVTPEQSAVFNVFPWLKHVPSWVPGFSFKRAFSSFRAMAAWWRDAPFEYTLTKKAHGTLGRCIIQDALSRINEDDTSAQEKQEAVKEASAVSFAAGVDTTASSVQVFVLAMTMYPEVQRRAQKEIETVVGSDRLPNFKDRPNLPYVEAVLRETMRWHPVAPLSLPHCNISDDIYNGYMIPRGTTIIPNTWAMAHDETKYPDPMTFNPSRFFDENGALNNDTVSYAFGFGRRVCLGRYLADGSTWSAIVHLLATFTFQRDEGSPPVLRFTTSLTSQPEPFKVDILPRYDAEKLVALLKSEE